MKTFCVETLGCKVNHYESEQIAALLRSRGLVETEASHADLRVVNTCSVTAEAAAKSRQSARRLVRLPVLPCGAVTPVTDAGTTAVDGTSPEPKPTVSPAAPSGPSRAARVIVTGCWASS